MVPTFFGFRVFRQSQRLNAVFSYIENRYDLEGKFFDGEQLARATQLAEDGHFLAREDPNELLDERSCARFLEYTFAVTEFPGTDTQAVNEVFGRINSYGKQLKLYP